MAHSYKRKLLVFHQSLAPYRIDFWNFLNQKFDLRLYFVNKNHLDQKFDQQRLQSLLSFKSHYLRYGFKIGRRVFRFGFLSIIRRLNPDIIFTYEYSQTTVFVLFIKKLFGFKYKVYSICDDSLDIAIHCTGLRKFFRNLLVERLDGLIVCSVEVSDWYTTNFKLKNNCIVFPIINREDQFQKELSLNSPTSHSLIRIHNLVGKKCILFVGRLAVVKGIDRLVQAFSTVQLQHPDAVVIIIGEGDQKRALEKLTASLNIQHKVLFVGRYEGSGLLAWYNIGQIFVLPSHYEPFGAVVNEALISGLKVLCSATAGSSSLIRSGFNGEIFNPHDVKNLSRLLGVELASTCPIQLPLASRPSKMLISFDEYTSNFNLL